MFRIEFTQYEPAYTFKAIDNVESIRQYNTGDGKIRLDIDTDAGFIPEWISYYASDSEHVVIDIVPIQG